MTQRRVLLAAGALIASGALLAGCTAPSEEPTTAPGEDTSLEALIEAAQGEGSLTVYTATSEQTFTDWVQPFIDEYGVSIDIYKSSTNPIVERFTQESDAGSHFADVLVLSDDLVFGDLADQGLVAEYTPESSDDFAGAGATREGYYYPLYRVLTSIAYNVDVVTPEEEKALQSGDLSILAEPSWNGKLAAANAHNSTNNTAFWYALAEKNDGLGWDFLEGVAANKPTFYDASPPMIERLIAGEFGAAILAPDTVVSPQVLAGAPVRFVYPEVTIGTSFVAGVSANAPHSNAARLFLEWATRPENQTAYSSITQGAPGSPKAADERQIAEESWYQPPAEIWFWATDPEIDFFSIEKDVLKDWDEVFGF